MSTYRAWYLSVAPLVLVASQLWAQAKPEPPLKGIVGVWQDTTGAGRTMGRMGKPTKDQIAAYAVLIKDKDGKVEVSQRYNQAGGSVTALQGSALVDSAVARLSTSAPSAADSASGYAPSANTSRLSDEDLKKVVGMFGPGESAVVLMSPEAAVSDIKQYLKVGGVHETAELGVTK